MSSIRSCTAVDLDAMEGIINAAAEKYRGAIPDDCWHEPYMPREQLESEIAAGVQFWGYCHPREGDPRHPREGDICHSREGGNPILLGVMGLQDVRDVTLIRHAYVLPSQQGKGIGSSLMRSLVPQAKSPLLVGTWAAAHWAIRFYEGHGFRLVTQAEKDRLLDTYWRISERQRETSVVLVHAARG